MGNMGRHNRCDGCLWQNTNCDIENEDIDVENCDDYSPICEEEYIEDLINAGRKEFYVDYDEYIREWN